LALFVTPPLFSDIISTSGRCCTQPERPVMRAATAAAASAASATSCSEGGALAAAATITSSVMPGVCKYYVNNGSCSAGASCRFTHPAAAAHVAMQATIAANAANAALVAANSTASQRVKLSTAAFNVTTSNTLTIVPPANGLLVIY
jgi:hypothetical protein